MTKAKVGPIVTAFIIAGVGLIFVLNRETKPVVTSTPPHVAPRPGDGKPKGGVETPIGDDVVKNHMLIAAVWLSSVGMAGMAEPAADVIHIEADIHATADNPNGFAKDEFVPYLKIHYDLSEAGSTKRLQSGELMPMVAADGLHYGANISKPAPGSYRLVYRIEPPSAGGLGRHTDPVGGVAPWWQPFDAAFDWAMSAGDGRP